MDETEYRLFRESDIQSSLSMPGRFTTMINTLDEVCAKYYKDYQRAYEYFPPEIGLILINLLASRIVEKAA